VRGLEEEEEGGGVEPGSPEASARGSSQI